MGVSGSGKSSVGAALARLEGAIYIDGDTLHPPTNLQKMSAGIPLDDDDRHPWLVKVAETLRAANGPTLIGCSALKRRYRDLIREGAGSNLFFIHLTGPREVIAGYMLARTGHFMPPSLLDSQYAALEPLDEDELGFAVDVAQPLGAVVAEAQRKLDQSRWKSAR
jgi:carbohydrate kinase (thermoresistant glucokinase family)